MRSSPEVSLLFPSSLMVFPTCHYLPNRVFFSCSIRAVNLIPFIVGPHLQELKSMLWKCPCQRGSGKNFREPCLLGTAWEGGQELSRDPRTPEEVRLLNEKDQFGHHKLVFFLGGKSFFCNSWFILSARVLPNQPDWQTVSITTWFHPFIMWSSRNPSPPALFTWYKMLYLYKASESSLIVTSWFY